MAKSSKGQPKTAKSAPGTPKPASKDAGGKVKSSAPAKKKMPAEGLAAGAPAVDATLKQQVEAELAVLDAEAKKAGQTTFCQCAVANKQDELITIKRVRRGACQRFSVIHNRDYNVALD